MVQESAKCCLVVLWILFIYASGMFFFTRGFFLSKTALETKSSNPHRQFCPESRSQRYEKLVLLIVDALRFDYVDYDENLNATPPAYRNKLPILKKLLDDKTNNALLYRFVADAPTLTVQGLKGLTTGTLPSYVNAGANFGASRVVEDSWLYQLTSSRCRRGKATFLGDNTWMSLFGDYFHRQMPVASFSIDDYLTVDDSIVENLYAELSRSDWDVLIAHFLGVDHAGHKEGIDSEAMAGRLTEFDKIMRNVVSLVDNTTLLVLLGDHGMTEDGMHGSDSPAEVESALFFYSKTIRFSTLNAVKTIDQIDLVPTISLLLGLPVPFSNLGFIIPEVFVDRDHVSLVNAARFNAQQLDRYLTAYYETAIYGNLLPLDYTRLKDQFHEIEFQYMDSNGNVTKFYSQYEQYAKEVQRIFRRLLTRDLKAIFAGILLIFVACCVNFSLFWHGSRCLSSVRIRQSFVRATICAALTSLSLSLLLRISVAESLLFGVAAGSGLGFLSLNKKGLRTISFSQITGAGCLGSIVLLLQCTILFSDSYIHNEDAVIDYAVKTALVVYLFVTIRSQVRRREAARTSIVVISLLTLGILTCSRLASNFRTCRSTLRNPCRDLESWSPPEHVRLIVSSICVGLAPCVVYGTWRSRSRLSRLQQYVIFSLLFLMSICVCLYWVAAVPDWQNVYFPRTVDALIIVLYLGTTLSSSMSVGGYFVPLLGATWIFLTMMQGHKLAPAMALMAIQTMMIYRLICQTSTTRVSWIEVVLWSTLSWQYFYFTGHHTALSSLRIQAGYIGLRGDVTPGWKMIVAGGLVAINTYSSQIWFTASLPLIRRKINPKESDSSSSFTDLAVSYLLCFGIKMLSVCLAVTWFLDHPAGMGTFTPRLLFEFAAVLCVFGTVLVSSLLACLSSRQKDASSKSIKAME